MQDKVSAFRTLETAEIPQPPTAVIQRPEDLAKIEEFPVFIKRPVSTASSGVRKVSNPGELQAAALALGLGKSELITQQQSLGPLAMVQAIADNGRLIAHHANMRVEEGMGGGASIKESIVLPSIPEHLRRLVGHLNWHGPISFDVILTASGPVVIDINPRLVEPMNAYLAGVDLVGAMLSLAENQTAPPQMEGRSGVRSHQLLLTILGAAQMHNSRVAVIRELLRALQGKGPYAGSVEELTPVKGDGLSAIPVLTAALAIVIRPKAWRMFHSGAVSSYALTPDGLAQIVSLA